MKSCSFTWKVETNNLQISNEIQLMVEADSETFATDNINE